jgi:hypothetical protein
MAQEFYEVIAAAVEECGDRGLSIFEAIGALELLKANLIAAATEEDEEGEGDEG